MPDEPDRDIPKSDASSIRDGSQWPRHHHREEAAPTTRCRSYVFHPDSHRGSGE